MYSNKVFCHWNFQEISAIQSGLYFCWNLKKLISFILIFSEGGIVKVKCKKILLLLTKTLEANQIFAVFVKSQI